MAGMTFQERVQLEIRDGVAQVTLTRAEKLNGLDAAMFQALNDALDQLASHTEVRAVVLTGAGSSFCAGLDLASFRDQGGFQTKALMQRHDNSRANFAQRAAYGWVELDAPVVVALQGNCLGGGLQIALAGDLRIAAPDTRLSAMEIKHGLIPDMGLSQTLPRLVRADIAKELIWSGRIVEAQEALELGLVTRVCNDPLADAHDLARSIASQAPEAIQASKRLLRDAWTSTATESLKLEEALQRQRLSAIGFASDETS